MQKLCNSRSFTLELRSKTSTIWMKICFQTSFVNMQKNWLFQIQPFVTILQQPSIYQDEPCWNTVIKRNVLNKNAP